MAFTVPVIAAFCLILLCAVAWSFFMGFMVGRGQNPETRIQDIAGILAPVKKTSEAAPSPSERLAPAEQDTAAQTTEKETAAVVTPPASPDAPQPFTRPTGEELSAWGETPVQKAAVADKTEKKTPAGGKTDTGKKENRHRELFDFSFQIAAFKSNNDAISLCDKLKKEGFRPTVRKSGKVHLVLLNLRGTDADAVSLADAMQKFKLGKPLQLSKKTRTPAPKKQERKK